MTRRKRIKKRHKAQGISEGFGLAAEADFRKNLWVAGFLFWT